MKFVNEVFEQLAACFVGELKGDGEIAHPKILKRESLDYSVESLKQVDEYLTFLYEHKPKRITKAWLNTVLWGGAYVGEVIRRNASCEHDWVSFEDWIQEHPEHLRSLGPENTLPVCAVLRFRQNAFTLPLNKVSKFINNGPEDGTWAYGAITCGLDASEWNK